MNSRKLSLRIVTLGENVDQIRGEIHIFKDFDGILKPLFTLCAPQLFSEDKSIFLKILMVYFKRFSPSVHLNFFAKLHAWLSPISVAFLKNLRHF